MPEEHADEFEVLDDYLRRLHEGEAPDRDKFLREHPELASALECLEVLEGMAPGENGDQGADWEPEEELGAHLPRDFGPYELLEEIGRGGMGVVYKARQKELDRTVAVKMILASHLASSEYVRRFQTEARAAARLHHPHIVPIHDVGRVHDQHYFVMEYIGGISLAERIAEGPIPRDEVVRLVTQVARAVAMLHQEGIVHRDLKPSNILLDASQRPYVTDFGLAKVFREDSDMTATGAIVGTPSYMAPEQASGNKVDVGPLSDVYALGAILYELLTGQPPFREETALDTLMQVLSGEPPLPRHINREIPRELELICLKCLARTPSDRYASADALADDLDRFLTGETLEARPPTLVDRTLSWCRREPALAARLAVLGVFFVVHVTNASLGAIDSQFTWRAITVWAIWVVGSLVFQQLVARSGTRHERRFPIPQRLRWLFRRGRAKGHHRTIPTEFVWGAFDSLMLLVFLWWAASGAKSAVVVIYPTLIVASGLWFRVRFVWFVTGLSLISYGILVTAYYLDTPERTEIFDRPDRHVIFSIMLVAIGSAVAFLVRRVRTLSAYCGQKV